MPDTAPMRVEKPANVEADIEPADDKTPPNLLEEIIALWPFLAPLAREAIHACIIALIVA